VCDRTINFRNRRFRIAAFMQRGSIGLVLRHVPTPIGVG
jgi:Tfp pilus assembly ATPase PilU